MLMVCLVLLMPRTAQAKLNKRDGVNYHNGKKETYYNLCMERVIENARKNGIDGKYSLRADGVKCYDGYVIVAAPLDVHPYGSLVETSLGMGIVLDTGEFAQSNKKQLDIAVGW